MPGVAELKDEAGMKDVDGIGETDVAGIDETGVSIVELEGLLSILECSKAAATNM